MDRDFLVNSLGAYFLLINRRCYSVICLGLMRKMARKEIVILILGFILIAINLSRHMLINWKEPKKIQRLYDKKVDLILINEAPPILQHEIIKYGILIKNLNQKILVEYKVESFYQYLDQLYKIIDRFLK